MPLRFGTGLQEQVTGHVNQPTNRTVITESDCLDKLQELAAAVPGEDLGTTMDKVMSNV